MQEIKSCPPKTESSRRKEAGSKYLHIKFMPERTENIPPSSPAPRPGKLYGKIKLLSASAGVILALSGLVIAPLGIAAVLCGIAALCMNKKDLSRPGFGGDSVRRESFFSIIAGLAETLAVPVWKNAAVTILHPAVLWMIAGLFAAGCAVAALRKSAGLAPDRICGMLFAAIGSFTAWAVLCRATGFPGQYCGAESFFCTAQSGFVFYGGIAAALSILPIYSRRHHISLRRTLDIWALFASVMIAFRKTGAFFHDRSLEHVTASTGRITPPVMPHLLVEAMLFAGLSVALALLAGSKNRAGDIFGRGMTGYALITLTAELLHGGTPRFSASAFPLLLLVAGAVFMVLNTAQKNGGIR